MKGCPTGHPLLFAFRQPGHEQRGVRPAVTISLSPYNSRVGLGIFCPIISQAKGYPFEVALPEDLPVSGVALSDQVKSLDWRARQAQFICKLPKDTVAEILAKLQTILA